MELGQGDSERQALKAETERIQLALKATTGEQNNDASHTIDDHHDDGGQQAGHVFTGLLPHSTEFQVIQPSTAESLMGHVKDGTLQPSLENCLQLNKTYQYTVTENLNRIKLVLEQNRERQKVLEAELAAKVNCQDPVRKRKPLTIYTIPYIKNVNGMGPPPNEDVNNMKKIGFKNPYDVKLPKQWSLEEEKILLTAVKSDVLKKILQPILNRKELEMQKLHDLSRAEHANPALEAEIKETIQDLSNQLAQISMCTEDHELIGEPDDKDFLNNIDWMKVASSDLNGEYTDIECRLTWQNIIHPSINRKKWTEGEDKTLAFLVDVHKINNWKQIATKLGTNRTAFMCLQRYQMKDKRNIEKGSWTTEEDELLREIVGTCRTGEVVPWPQVSYYMEGRTVDQCRSRYEQLDETTNRGRFTEIEDMLLRDAVKFHGAKNWKQIATFVPRRLPMQCRERWFNNLENGLKFDKWVYEEDRTLLGLVGRYGIGKWASFVRYFPGRTDNMLLQRHKKLVRWKEENDWFDKLPAVVKKVLSQSEKNFTLRRFRDEEQRLRREITEVELDLQEAMKKEEFAGIYSWQRNIVPEEEANPASRHLKKHLENLKTQSRLLSHRSQLKLTAIKERHDHEKQEIVDCKQRAVDRKKGIKLPRPLPFDLSIAKKHLQHIGIVPVRKSQDQKYQDNTKEIRNQISQVIQVIQEMKDTDDKDDDSTTKKPSRKEKHSHLATLAEHLTKPPLLSLKNWVYYTAEDAKVDDELVHMFKLTSVTNRKRGRPRRYYAGEGFWNTSHHGVKVDTNEGDRTFQILLPITAKALQVDTKGAAVNSAVIGHVFQHLKNEQEKYLTNLASTYIQEPVVPKQETSIIAEAEVPPGKRKRGRKKGQKNKKQPNLPTQETATVVEPDVPILEPAIRVEPDVSIQDAPPGKRKRGRKKGSKNKKKSPPPPVEGKPKEPAMGELVSRLEVDQSLFSNVLVEEEEQCHQDSFASSSLQDRINVLSRTSNQSDVNSNNMRRKLSDDDIMAMLYKEGYILQTRSDNATEFDLPPMPPNVTTLNAFKKILLKRSSLIEIAGQFYMPEGSPNTIVKVNLAGTTSPKKYEYMEDTGDGHSSHEIPQEKVIIDIITNLKDEFHNVYETRPIQEDSAVYTHMRQPIFNIREDPEYKLLSERVKALFLWPAILSTVEVSASKVDKQNEACLPFKKRKIQDVPDDITSNSTAVRSNNYKYKAKKRGRPKKINAKNKGWFKKLPNSDSENPLDKIPKTKYFKKKLGALPSRRSCRISKSELDNSTHTDMDDSIVTGRHLASNGHGTGEIDLTTTGDNVGISTYTKDNPDTHVSEQIHSEQSMTKADMVKDQQKDNDRI